MSDQNHIPEILLEGLTEEQKQAVSAAPEGHLRIAARRRFGKDRGSNPQSHCDTRIRCKT